MLRPRGLVAARALPAVPPIQQSETHLSGLVTTKLWAAARPCSSLSCTARAARLRLQYGVRARCASSSFSPFWPPPGSQSLRLLRVFLCPFTLQLHREPILSQSSKAMSHVTIRAALEQSKRPYQVVPVSELGSIHAVCPVA
ncbi:hypothetical protein N657DRAFT_325621 [Parathielavia appendiculata]|uniref:Uncharacterized protein n=1 Tax=Parathielavia appendiculata TaxID=2587402 RepID=A0AAN6TQL1_9PEZI|nr:hypothetical protein N657DRAFT_325621 [Parathielavia appendiculata]